MAEINLKSLLPDTSLPTTGFLFGADSQSAASPSVYSTQTVATTLLGSTTLTGQTVTADAPVLNMAQTWNNSGVAFTGLKANITDTASSASSLLMDLRVGNVSQFTMAKNGYIGIGGQPSVSYAINAPSLSCLFNSAIANSFFLTTNFDVVLTRRAAANLRLGAADAAAPVAQTLSVQSGTAGASATTVSISGTALTIAGTVTGAIAIGHAVTGTGVSAGTVIVSGSGTSWTVNNSQTVGPITAYFNSVGQNLTITGSQGSGPSAGGSIVFQVAPAGSAGTTAQNALATALTIAGDRRVTVNSILSLNGDTAWLEAISTGVFRVGSATADGRGIIGLRTIVGSSGYYAFSSTNSVSDATYDVALFRDNTGILALRNGASPQSFRVYNTTDGTNSEFGKIAWSSNVLQIGTEKAGTGTARALAFQTDGTTRLTIGTNGNITTTSINIGSESGLGALTNSPNAIYANSFIAGSYVRINGGSSTSGNFKCPGVDGVLTLLNWNDNGFDRLQFGGTTSSFPALKRSSTTLQARLADDSAFASVQGKLTTDTAYTAGDPTTTGYIVLYDSTGTAYRVPAVLN